MPTKMKITLSATAIICSAIISSVSAQAMPAKIFSIAPNLIGAESVVKSDGIMTISGYHWVNPYYRKDGTFVRGHMRGNPDGFCWNNLGGC